MLSRTQRVAIYNAQRTLYLDAGRRPSPLEGVRIMLENTAGAGSSIGRSFEELAAIVDAVGDAARVGVCLDTCHLFAAGYDLRRRSGYEAAFLAVRFGRAGHRGGSRSGARVARRGRHQSRHGVRGAKLRASAAGESGQTGLAAATYPAWARRPWNRAV